MVSIVNHWLFLALFKGDALKVGDSQRESLDFLNNRDQLNAQRARENNEFAAQKDLDAVKESATETHFKQDKNFRKFWKLQIRKSQIRKLQIKINHIFQILWLFFSECLLGPLQACICSN